MVNTLLRGFLHLLYPPCCHLCGRSTSDDREDFCERCVDVTEPSTLSACPRCASTVGPYSSVERGCVACRSERFAFNSVLRFGVYDGALRHAVLMMKGRSGELLAEVLGRVWARAQREYLLDGEPTHLVPIPLHWTRRWKRGHDQAIGLCRGLASELGLPVASRWLVRNRSTSSQHLLTPTERRQNMQDAFTARPSRLDTSARVILVDDVMTTGSTAHESARALRRSGVTTLRVVVLARAGRQAGTVLLS